MYKKAVSLLLAGNLIVVLGLFLTGAVSDAKTDPEPASQLTLEGLEDRAECSLTLEEAEDRAECSLTLEEAEDRAECSLTLEEAEDRAECSLTLEEAEDRAECSLTLEGLEKRAGQRETGPAPAQNISLGLGTANVAVSGQRVVDYALLERSGLLCLSEEELETLQRIVEAEAGSEDEDGRLLVANVVLNRVNSESFPETVTEVVFQQMRGVYQFSPVGSGRFYTVEISELTVSAVERALAGEDISEGALFFASRRYANSDKMRWFDENLTFLFKHGGHEFFK